MPANFVKSDDQKNARVKQALRAIREGRAILGQELAVADQMRDGNGSEASHYDLFASEKGYAAGDYVDANTAAKAAYDELASLHFKLTTNASVTDVAAAIDQACAKFGV